MSSTIPARMGDPNRAGICDQNSMLGSSFGYQGN